MVCLGNICRSPLAEGILRSKLSPDFEVDSAGTSAFHQGEPPDERSIRVAKNHGIDISAQRSRAIQPDDLENFDIIYCMDTQNWQDVRAMATNQAQKEKIKLILRALPFSTITEVPDPYYGDDSGFEKVYKLLDQASEVIAQDLKSKK